MANILMVEDDSQVAEMFREGLEQRGYTVDWAPGASDAVKLAFDSRYDVVLMDLTMRGIDGVLTALALRGLGGWCAAVPILAVSGAVLPIDAPLFERAGFAALLRKPIKTSEIAEEIERQLSLLPPPPTILLVDDDPAFGAVFRRTLLRMMDCGTDIATSGEEGLALLLSSGRRYSLAVVDLRMPGMSGLDLARRAHEAGCSVPMVAMSGADPEPEDEADVAAHFEELIRKPPEYLRLLGIVQRYSSRRR